MSQVGWKDKANTNQRKSND